MDVFGIPLPSNVGVGDEEVSVNVSCCAVRRNPPPSRTLDFIASGRDDEGVRQTRIRVTLFIVCTHTVMQRHLVLGANGDPTGQPGASSPSSSPPAQAPAQRIAQGKFRLGDYLVDNPCPNFNIVEELRAETWAEVENHHGDTAATQVLELDWP